MDITMKEDFYRRIEPDATLNRPIACRETVARDMGSSLVRYSSPRKSGGVWMARPDDVGDQESAQPTNPSSENQRRTKFTDANVRQIINLVERGRSPAEIAEVIGVTEGTLRTTCSKLQISLRPPTFDTGTGLLRHRRRRSSPSGSTIIAHQTDSNGGVLTLVKPATDQEPIAEPNAQPQAKDSPLATVSIVMEYKGQTHAAQLPLTPDLLGQLAIEAEFRGMNLVQLIATAVELLAKEDRFDVVLGNLRHAGGAIGRMALDAATVASSIRTKPGGALIAWPAVPDRIPCPPAPAIDASPAALVTKLASSL
jgi:hypothetical protein